MNEVTIVQSWQRQSRSVKCSADSRETAAAMEPERPGESRAALVRVAERVRIMFGRLSPQLSLDHDAVRDGVSRCSRLRVDRTTQLIGHRAREVEGWT